MNYGFCHLSATPLRKEPSDTSEMVSQLLFGEVFHILESSPKWSKIETQYDMYQAWIDNRQFTPISLKKYENISLWERSVTEITPIESEELIFFILPGSALPEENSFCVGRKEFLKKRGTRKDFWRNIETTAMQFLNTPYLWGGRSLFGIDCSGFVQIVFAINNIRLLRDTCQQATQGAAVQSFMEAKKNDLLFFKNADEKIIHVGIYLGNSKIIHASGCVRIDSVDEQGIYNKDVKNYTHQLACIRRVEKDYF